jgi:hypothetical protein
MLFNSGSFQQLYIHCSDVEETIAAFDAVREKLRAGEYRLEGIYPPEN